jgi:tyrosyl-tRNA synthetase
LNAEDEKVIEYLKIFANRTRDEIGELEALTKEQPHLRAAQRALADDVTDLVHSKAERQAATEAASAVFGRGELRGLDEPTLKAIFAELKSATLPAGGELPSVIDAFEATGIVKSRGEARRAIQEGGAYVNNQKVADVDARLSQADLLQGRYAIVRRGKKTVGAVEIARG